MIAKTRLSNEGFSMVEILVTVVLIGILAAIAYTGVGGSKDKAYYTRSVSDLRAVANAATLYSQKYGTYPADVSRDIPSEIKEFIDPNVNTDNWPDGVYPNSVFDWDAWDMLNAATNTKGTDGINDTFQISLRFCPAGGPLASCKFPKETWASSFGINSAAYWCIKGYCRAHQSETWNYPGYCINCTGNGPVKTPDNQ